MTGALVYNGNETVFNHEHGDYLVSVSPNLGMITTFIGGHFGSGSLLRPSARVEERVGPFCIRHTSQIRYAPNLIVFLSARSNPDEAWEGRGYFEVQPPVVLRKIGNPNHGLKTLYPMNMDSQTYDGKAKQLQLCSMVAQDYLMKKSSEICDTGHLWLPKLT